MVEALVAIAAFSFPYEEATLGLVVIGTIIGLIATTIGFVTWRSASSDRRTRQQEEKRIRDLEDDPFERLRCWIKKAEPPVLANCWHGELLPAEIDGRDPDYKTNEDILGLSKTQYFIYIQVFAKMGMTIHKANLRFLGNDPRPQVMNLKVPNVPGDSYRVPDSQGGHDLYHEISVSEGRAINYAARIGIEAEYTGALSLRLELRNTGRDYRMKIPCTTQDPPALTT